MKEQKLIPSINFHLWAHCNMRCKFCFAQFQDVKSSVLPKGHLAEEDALKIVRAVAEYGFEKITFVGGEPMLCPWLPELIKEAKRFGLTTMIVTNGSLLTEKFLSTNENYLDWITISIDSLDMDINQKIGRGLNGVHPLSMDKYIDLIEKVHHYNYGLKINTVVNAYNKSEDLNEFIKYAQPKRWKIFQALPIAGQNDKYIEELSVSKSIFEQYIERHSEASNYPKVIAESNSAMQGSYVMIDPAGRFFDNVNGKHRYSRPILSVGMQQAIDDIELNYQKFIDRQGVYDWKID